MDRAAVEPGHALQHRYAENDRKYGDACHAEGIVFKAMPLEVLGGFHEVSVGIVRQLGQALARVGGQDEAEVTRHLFGRLSVLLMRGNSQLVLSRSPRNQENVIDGNL